MIPLHELKRRLADARAYKADWNQKAERLTEITLGLDPGQRVRKSVEEAGTNYLLVNLTLKVASLVGAYRAAKVKIYGAPEQVAYWFNDFVKDAALYDVEDMLKDRFITGLGVMAIGSENGKAFLYRVDPLHVWWSPRFGLRTPAWVIRRFYEGDMEFYEYWDAQYHAVWTEERSKEQLLFCNPNPLGFIPVRFVPNFQVPRVDFPVGDVELAYPQQRLINEIRRSLLEQARRGQGFYEVAETDVEPYELEKLNEPGEPFIRTRTGNAIKPLPSPPVNAEWLQLEAIAKNDLDAQSGVSEYLRGSMPVANNIKFATQVLAALGAQNLRIQADWTPLKELIEWAAVAWARWAAYNGESRKIGDLIVDMREVDVKAISAVLSEDDVPLVSGIGISPEAIAQAGGVGGE